MGSNLGTLVFGCKAGELYHTNNNWFWKSGSEVKLVDVTIEYNILPPANTKIILNLVNGIVQELDSENFLYKYTTIEDVAKFTIKYDGINFVKYVWNANKLVK